MALLYLGYQVASLTLVYPLSRGLGVLAIFVLESLFRPPSWSPLSVAGIVAVTLGTSCLAFPSFKGAESRGVLYSALIGLLLGIAFYLGKISGAHISPLTYLWGMYFSSFLFLFLFLRENRLARVMEAGRAYWAVGAVIGAGSFLSYLLILILFKTVPASTVIAVREFSVVFGCILGFVFLREKATPLKVGAIITIVTGAMMLKCG